MINTMPRFDYFTTAEEIATLGIKDGDPFIWAVAQVETPDAEAKARAKLREDLGFVREEFIRFVDEPHYGRCLVVECTIHETPSPQKMMTKPLACAGGLVRRLTISSRFM